MFVNSGGNAITEGEHFRKAIAAGANIVHINTELRVAWRNLLAESLANAPNEVVPYKLLRPVVDSVKKVIGSRLRLFHGEKVALPQLQAWSEESSKR